jgi:hypothetical protein
MSLPLAAEGPRALAFDRRKAWLCAVGLMLALKLAAVVLYVPASKSIFDLGFSFDPYVRSLYDGEGFRSCAAYGCDHSTRMPALPFFVYALSFLTLNLRVAAAIKAIVLSAVVYFAARDFAERLAARSRLYFALYAGLAAFVIFSPDLIKHMTALQYEEGYLIEIQAVTVLTILTLVAKDARERRLRDFLLPVAFASLAYLFKSSQILVWAVVTVTACVAAAQMRRPLLAAGLAAFALVAPASWLAHNVATGDRASIMSSYDGENMFRGWNAHTLDLFPACHLDTLFVALRTCEGKVLDLPHEIGRPAFPDEWAWNDGYKTRATDWIHDNPGAAAKTFAVKAATFLLWPRMVPYLLMDESSETRRKPAEEILSGLWLAVGRVIELAALGMGGWLALRGRGRTRALGVVSLALLTAYAAPYILGFSTERHFSLFILMSALCAYFLIDAMPGPGAGRQRP